MNAELFTPFQNNSPRPAQRGEVASLPLPSGEGRGEGRSSTELLADLKQTAINNGNVFEALMHAVRACSLGQITHALFEVGGQYRRNM